MTIALGCLVSRSVAQDADVQSRSQKEQGFDRQINENAVLMMDQGKLIFRYDTFGDEVYWTDLVEERFNLICTYQIRIEGSGCKTQNAQTDPMITMYGRASRQVSLGG